MEPVVPEDHVHQASVPHDSSCPFCTLQREADLLLENELCFAVLDRYPVSAGHTLVVPRRHVPDCFQLTAAELFSAAELLQRRRLDLLESDPSVRGFNVGTNCGGVAGQTIAHCHIHLIPRRRGDTLRPQGGVRGAVPGRMGYPCESFDGMPE